MLALLLATVGCCAEVPETHFGFYTQGNRCAYPERMPDFFRAQAEDGFSASTVGHNASSYFQPTEEDRWYFDGTDGIHVFGDGLAAFHAIPHPLFGPEGAGSEHVMGFCRQMDAMVESGLVSQDGPPLLCYSLSPHDMDEARYFAKVPWPELLVAVRDEPNIADNPELGDEVIEQIRAAHAVGLRAGTSIVAGHLMAPFESKLTGKTERLIDWLDVAILLASTWGDNIARQARMAGCELWGYECIDHARSHPGYTRYLAGLWAWRNKPRCLLRWAYTHDPETKVLPDGTQQWAKNDSYSFVLPTPSGDPVETPFYTAYLRGMEDYRLLCDVERKGTPEAKAWLWRLRASLPPSAARPYFAPGGDKDPTTAKLARGDFDAIRAEARRLLAEEGGNGA